MAPVRAAGRSAAPSTTLGPIVAARKEPRWQVVA